MLALVKGSFPRRHEVQQMLVQHNYKVINIIPFFSSFQWDLPDLVASPICACMHDNTYTKDETRIHSILKVRCVEICTHKCNNNDFHSNFAATTWWHPSRDSNQWVGNNSILLSIIHCVSTIMSWSAYNSKVQVNDCRLDPCWFDVGV